jgi:DNA-directed RNA polymerase specialized sigma subunit
MIDRYTEYKEYVIERIDKLPNERSRDVIYDRYILFMSFSEISAQLGGIDIRWIKRIHKRALQEYGEIAEKSTKCCSNY